MKVSVENNNLILSGVRDFNLEHIFECGQCFRWNKESDESYVGVAYNKPLRISQDKDVVTLYETSEEDFYNIWYHYFDFETDYSKIKSELSHDKVLKTAISYGDGIRILNQDLWECVVSFIISASNNIPRIKKIIASLCELFGEKCEYMGNIYYTFPTPEKVYSLTLEELSQIKAGFRHKYIMAAAECFCNDFSKNNFEALSYDESKKLLMSIKGIGNKVADCVLLFSLAKRNSFPVDVWIKRIMEYCYFDSEQPVSVISDFSKQKFCDLGGYAQQYLFYYAREQKIGL